MSARKNRRFTPSSLGVIDRLEERVVLSGVTMFRGVPALTTHALAKSLREVQNAFNTFKRTLDHDRLAGDLAKAANRLPFHRVDGLGASVREILVQMRQDIADGVPKPVQTAYRAVVQAARDQIQARVDSGTVVLR